MTKIAVIKKEPLTPEEFKKVSQLSINQIIEHYPDLLIKAINNSISVQNIQQQLGLQATNNRARKCIKDFAEQKVGVNKYSIDRYLERRGIKL